MFIPPSSRPLKHQRLDITGLRAIAVLGVVAYHVFHVLWPEFNWLPGGFLGVDVFFVLSGFLMTGIIMRDLERERFSFYAFIKRRAQRICPGLLVVVALCLGFGLLVLSTDDLLRLAYTAAWALLMGSNVYSAFSTDYFASVALDRPLLHTWSLGVEWQFYLLYPWLLILLKRYCVPELLPRALWILTLLSGLLSCYGAQLYAQYAYYLLPTRAFELLAGSLAFFYPLSSPQHVLRVCVPPHSLVWWHKMPPSLAEAVGLILIVAAFLGVDAQSAWPNLSVIFPIFGTYLCLAANHQRSLLRWGFFQRLGLWSYAIYLVHWPILVLAAKLGFVWLWQLERLLPATLSESATVSSLAKIALSSSGAATVAHITSSIASNLQSESALNLQAKTAFSSDPSVSAVSSEKAYQAVSALPSASVDIANQATQVDPTVQTVQAALATQAGFTATLSGNMDVVSELAPWQGLGLLGLLLVGIVLLGALLHYAVERRRNYGYITVGLYLGILGFSLYVALTGMPQRLSFPVSQYAQYGGHGIPSDGKLHEIGDIQRPVDLILVGDSFARHYTLDLQERALHIVSVLADGCYSWHGYINRRADGALNSACQIRYAETLKALALYPDVPVVIAQDWQRYVYALEPRLAHMAAFASAPYEKERGSKYLDGAASASTSPSSAALDPANSIPSASTAFANSTPASSTLASSDSASSSLASLELAFYDALISLDSQSAQVTRLQSYMVALSSDLSALALAQSSRHGHIFIVGTPLQPVYDIGSTCMYLHALDNPLSRMLRRNVTCPTHHVLFNPKSLELNAFLEREVTKHTRFSYLDPNAALCVEKDCELLIDGLLPVYQDGLHYSWAGSVKVVSYLLHRIGVPQGRLRLRFEDVRSLERPSPNTVLSSKPKTALDFQQIIDSGSLTYEQAKQCQAALSVMSKSKSEVAPQLEAGTDSWPKSESVQYRPIPDTEVTPTHTPFLSR